jgi:hypothetical protein
LLWKDNDFKKSKKNLGHALRYLLLGLQILEHGTIIDYGAVNSISTEIITRTCQNFEDYEREYRPYYNKFWTQFRDFMHAEMDPLWLTVGKVEHPLCGCTIKLIQEKGIYALPKFLSIQLSFHPQHPNLVSLQADQDSPPDCTFTIESNGVVLDSENAYSVVAFPDWKAFNHQETSHWKRHKLTDPWRVFRHLEGDQTIVFWYKNEVGTIQTVSSDNPSGWSQVRRSIKFVCSNVNTQQSCSFGKFGRNKDTASPWTRNCGTHLLYALRELC